MKLVEVLIISCLLTITLGCEYHDMLERMRKAREQRRLLEEQQSRELLAQYRDDRIRHAQSEALNDVRRALSYSNPRQPGRGTRQTSYVNHDSSHGSSHSSVSGGQPTYYRKVVRTQPIVMPEVQGEGTHYVRRVIKTHPLVHRRNDYSSSYVEEGTTGPEQAHPFPGLPAGMKFCPGSNEFFCSVSDRCIMDETGAYKCRSQKTHVLPTSRVYVPSSGSTYTHSDRYVYPLRPTTRYYPRKPYVGGSTVGRQDRLRYVSKCPNGTTNETSSRVVRCIDINECLEDPCDEHASCINTYRSYRCRCENGYEMLNEVCEDRDECESNPCGQLCVNTPGSYECECSDGYRKTFGSCREINECNEGSPCNATELCLNTYGSYQCFEPHPCPDGYQRKGSLINSNCYPENGRAEAGQPTAYSYQKMAVDANMAVGREVGSMTFRSDPRYYHNFSVEVLEGGDSFRYTSESNQIFQNQLKLKFYSKASLTADREIKYILRITDTPRRKSYSSTYNLSPMVRQVEITVLPLESPYRRGY